MVDRIALGFSEKKAAEIIEQLATTVQYLHGNGIVHRNLIVDSIFYSSPKPDAPIKLLNFNLAKFNPEGVGWDLTTPCGTPAYTAPEILMRVPYGPAADMWSLGVLLYILLCGFPPFLHEHNVALFELIKKGEFSFISPFWDNISDSAKNLVSSLLVVNPRKRLTPRGVLEHPWLAKGMAPSTPFSSDYTRNLLLLEARNIMRKSVKVVVAMGKFAALTLSESKHGFKGSQSSSGAAGLLNSLQGKTQSKKLGQYFSGSVKKDTTKSRRASVPIPEAKSPHGSPMVTRSNSVVALSPLRSRTRVARGKTKTVEEDNSSPGFTPVEIPIAKLKSTARPVESKQADPALTPLLNPLQPSKSSRSKIPLSGESPSPVLNDMPVASDIALTPPSRQVVEQKHDSSPISSPDSSPNSSPVMSSRGSPMFTARSIASELSSRSRHPILIAPATPPSSSRSSSDSN